MDMVDIVKSLVWTEWSSMLPNPVHGYVIRPYSYSSGIVTHWITELGDTTNNYRYAVYYKRILLVGKVVSPGCCNLLRKCPIKYCSIPLTPCREVLRSQAMELAHQVWVEFITSLAHNK